MKIYQAKYIKIQGDGIYGIFESDSKEQINNVIDCCVELNTFKTHLNKQINKLLFDKKNDDEENKILIDYGIGRDFHLKITFRILVLQKLEILYLWVVLLIMQII